MAGRRVRGVVCALVLLAVGSAGATVGGNEQGRASANGTPQDLSGPQITGQVDRSHARMTATHKGLIVRKTTARADRSFSLELQYHGDVVFLAVDGDGVPAVRRAGGAVRVDSPDALRQVQQVLAGSEAIFAFRALLAERESVSDLKAPEFTLLASAAFVASLVGDTDAPRRLSARFVEKHRGIVRPVAAAGASCWDDYSGETTGAWNDLQNCMAEANQDPSFFNGAYRRLACNAVWILESESAWFEYIQCLNPLAISG